MSTTYTGREPETSPTDAEGILFAPNPVWDRGKKRRGFGASRARAPEARTEPRSFDTSAAPSVTPSATMTNSTLAAEEAPYIAPTARRTTRVQRSGPSGAAIAIGLGAVVALGAVGYWTMQPRDADRVAALTPGETTSQVAGAPVTPPAASGGDLNTATNTLPQRAAPPPAAAPPARMARNTAAAPAARVRPAARSGGALSAGSASADVSATIPDGPRPYSQVNPSAPTQVTPPAPSQVSPAAPRPTEATPPAAVPAPPPVQSAPAPTQSEPPPETTTPPTN